MPSNLQIILVAGVSVFFLIPATSAIMAWLFLNETLTNIDVIGFLIASVGVYIATRN